MALPIYEVQLFFFLKMLNITCMTHKHVVQFATYNWLNSNVWRTLWILHGESWTQFLNTESSWHDFWWNLLPWRKPRHGLECLDYVALGATDCRDTVFYRNDHIRLMIAFISGIKNIFDHRTIIYYNSNNYIVYLYYYIIYVYYNVILCCKIYGSIYISWIILFRVMVNL